MDGETKATNEALTNETAHLIRVLEELKKINTMRQTHLDWPASGEVTPVATGCLQRHTFNTAKDAGKAIGVLSEENAGQSIKHAYNIICRHFSRYQILAYAVTMKIIDAVMVDQPPQQQVAVLKKMYQELCQVLSELPSHQLKNNAWLRECDKAIAAFLERELSKTCNIRMTARDNRTAMVALKTTYDLVFKKYYYTQCLESQAKIGSYMLTAALKVKNIAADQKGFVENLAAYEQLYLEQSSQKLTQVMLSDPNLLAFDDKGFGPPCSLGETLNKNPVALINKFLLYQMMQWDDPMTGYCIDFGREFLLYCRPLVYRAELQTINDQSLKMLGEIYENVFQHFLRSPDYDWLNHFPYAEKIQHAVASLGAIQHLRDLPKLPMGKQMVLAVGDSYYRGFGVGPEHSVITLMGNHLKQYPSMKDIQMVNASVSRRTSSEGVKALSKLLHIYRPAFVLLGFGPNNMLNGEPMHNLYKDVEEMAALCRQYNAKLIYAAARPNSRLFKSCPIEFEDVQQRIGRIRGVRIIVPDRNDLLYGMLQQDKIHPNIDSNRQVAAKVTHLLVDIIKQPRVELTEPNDPLERSRSFRLVK